MFFVFLVSVSFRLALAFESPKRWHHTTSTPPAPPDRKEEEEVDNAAAGKRFSFSTVVNLQCSVFWMYGPLHDGQQPRRRWKYICVPTIEYGIKCFLGGKRLAGNCFSCINWTWKEMRRAGYIASAGNQTGPAASQLQPCGSTPYTVYFSYYWGTKGTDEIFDLRQQMTPISKCVPLVYL